MAKCGHSLHHENGAWRTWTNGRTDTNGIPSSCSPTTKKSRISLARNPALVKTAALYFCDSIGTRITDLLADHRDPVLLCQGTTRAHDRSRGVNLPAKLRHHFFESRTFGPFEHLDQLSGLAGRAGFVRTALYGLLRSLPCRDGLRVVLGRALSLRSLGVRGRSFGVRTAK